MAGFTNFSVAKLNNKTVYLPIKELLKTKVKENILFLIFIIIIYNLAFNLY
jgi:hypothetical protein